MYYYNIDIENHYYIALHGGNPMKKKEKDPKIIFDVHKDAELEALAKAYVQAAYARKMTQTQATQVLAQIWREDIIIPKEEKRLSEISLKETQKQKDFRKKVEKMVDEYPEFIYHRRLDSSSDYRQYTIEVICAIYKMFLEKDRIQGSTMLHFIRDYFMQSFSNPNYSNTTIIDYTRRHISSTLDSLYFSTTKYSGIKFLRHVDLNSKPTIYQSEPSLQSSLRKISSLYEPYAKRQEYLSRNSKTATAVIELIWFVETFF